MLERVQQCRNVDEIIIATGDGPENDALEHVVRSAGFGVFRGPEDDVLERYAQAAEQLKADVIVRLTGDCPLMDPVGVDSMIQQREEGEYDYCTNVLPPTWPDGMDISVFTKDILEAARIEAVRPSDREHVVP